MLVSMTTLQKTALGARWGLVMASLLSVWVLAIAVINGSLTMTSRTGETYFVPAIIAFYLAGGAASGATIGSLTGLLRWRVGAVLVGMLAVIKGRRSSPVRNTILPHMRPTAVF